VAAPCAPWHCVRGPVRKFVVTRPFNGIVRPQVLYSPHALVLLAVIGLLSGPWVLDSGNPLNPPNESGDAAIVGLASMVLVLANVGFRFFSWPEKVREHIRIWELASAFFVASGTSAWIISLMQHRDGENAFITLGIGVGALLGAVLSRVLYRGALAT